MEINRNIKKVLKWILSDGVVGVYRRYKKSCCRPYAPVIKVINYQVNNFCNSRCVMCNVWKKKDNKYINTKSFQQLLSDPFFSEVEHIGITGGEPSLVHELPEYFEVSINTLPKLRGLSLITNSLMPERLKEQIKTINTICNSNNKAFSIMLSLDGTNEVHNKNRGIEKSFDKFLDIMSWLKNEQIPFSTGTTITKCNVWNLDQLLLFVKENGIYGRFRIAEYINRLYNNTEDCHNYIKCFDEDEKYQLILFFSKLIYGYEVDETIKNTYYSIINMLMGGKRLIECPYKNKEAVNIGCHGDMAYCAPKSPIIGYLPGNSARKLYLRNVKTLEYIKESYCDYCIHDYHSSATHELLQRNETEHFYRKLINIDAYNSNKESLKFEKSVMDKHSVFIIGWYGTETVGDKAILGGIIDHYMSINKNDVDIYISSLFPFVTERTVHELGAIARVVPVYSKEFFTTASSANEVVVGGGPLMEIEELALIEWAFRLAKQNNNRTIVYGCGIGPLYSDEKTGAVREVLELSDDIKLRDARSIEYAKLLCNNHHSIDMIEDPSIEYIKKIETQIAVNKEPGKLSCFLRELTFEYRSTMSYQEFIEFKEDFEDALAKNIIYLCKENNLVPHLYSMHNFVVGNDDRDFNFRFAAKYLKNTECKVEERLSSVTQIIKEMKSSGMNLCMRFHSMVFADTLSANYVAIDYTSGGKIFSFLEDRDKLNHIIDMRQIINDETTIFNKVR